MYREPEADTEYKALKRKKCATCSVQKTNSVSNQCKAREQSSLPRQNSHLEARPRPTDPRFPKSLRDLWHHDIDRSPTTKGTVRHRQSLLLSNYHKHRNHSRHLGPLRIHNEPAPPFHNCRIRPSRTSPLARHANRRLLRHRYGVPRQLPASIRRQLPRSSCNIRRGRWRGVRRMLRRRADRVRGLVRDSRRCRRFDRRRLEHGR